MPWNGSGSYVLPPAYSPEVNGTVIDAVRYNGLTTDVASGISNALAKDGQNVPTANLPMGGFKHTGAADANSSGQYLVYGQSTAAVLGGSLTLSAAAAVFLQGGSTALNTLVGITTFTSNRQQFGTTFNTSSSAQFYFANAASGAPYHFFAKSRGVTIGAHTIVQNGDVLGGISANGSDGSVFTESVRMRFNVGGTPALGVIPGQWQLYTANAAGTLTLALEIGSSQAATFYDAVTVQGAIAGAGAIRSSSATGGVGYSTGAGASVVQATSKITGVTINAPVGQITTNNASLGAGLVASFTVTNSAVSPTDLPVVVIRSGATVGAYTTQVSAVGVGSFQISVRNETAGALGEAIVLMFALVKGVIS